MLAGLLAKCDGRTALGGWIWLTLYHKTARGRLDKKHKRAYIYGREVFDYETQRRGATNLFVETTIPLLPDSLIGSQAILGFCSGLLISHDSWYWDAYIKWCGATTPAKYKLIRQSPSYIYGKECMSYEAIRRGGVAHPFPNSGLVLPRW